MDFIATSYETECSKCMDFIATSYETFWPGFAANLKFHGMRHLATDMIRLPTIVDEWRAVLRQQVRQKPRQEHETHAQHPQHAGRHY